MFETSPLKDITDESATVTYVSDFDFHSATDSFQFIASDGLADSNVATAFIDVARNFRPPEAIAQAVATPEDVPIDIVLAADDPDGIVDIDFNGLDVLSFQIVDSPEHGELAFVSNDNESATYTYTPDPDFFGQDHFTFKANDGVDDSEPAEVSIEVTYVDDPPVVLDNELPPRIGLGFPFVFRGRFADDGADALDPVVVWNDETTIGEGGVNDDDEDNPRIEGIMLIEPVGGNGEGYGIAQHVFTEPGPKTVRFCIDDQDARGECLESEITPEPLVNLGVDLPADFGENPPEPVTAGDSFSIDVVVDNLQPEGVAGLEAEAIVMQGHINGSGAVFVGSSETGCTIEPDGLSIDCDLGDFAVGEQRVVTLHFDTDPDVDTIADVDIELSFTTASQAVNDDTQAYMTRTVRNPDYIFGDRFGSGQ